jgi:hypothetical protein
MNIEIVTQAMKDNRLQTPHVDWLIEQYERVEELECANEDLQIAHDVMFARIRNNNGQYTPDEVSRLIDGELLKRETEFVRAELKLNIEADHAAIGFLIDRCKDLEKQLESV